MKTKKGYSERIKNKMRVLLDDTVSHFNLSNRCKMSKHVISQCTYTPYKGSKSIGDPIGKHLTHKHHFYIKMNDLHTVRPEYLFGCFHNARIPIPEILKNIPFRFLDMIQDLHDNPDNWDEECISEHGKIVVNSIKKQFDL